MGTLEYIFIVIYAILMITYLYTSSLGRSKIRGVNKILLALTYLVLAFIELAIYRSYSTFEILIVIALFFTFLGDVILLFHFVIGAIFFSLGNVCLFAYNLITLSKLGYNFGSYGFFILVLVIIMSSYFIFAKYGNYVDLKKDKIKAFFYLLFVSLHGSVGLFLIFIAKTTWLRLLGIGCVLFMISDYLLCTYTYSIKKNEIVHKLNTLCYFCGIFLITLSIIPI